MAWRTIAIVVIAGVVAGGILAGCAKKSNVVLIGEYNALTGATADFGTSAHRGIQLAIEEINAKGGLLGKKVVLKTEDDRSDASEAATAVQKLITRDRVVAVLGEVASKKTLTAAPVAQDNHVPMITPASTNPNVTKVGDYIFRVCFTDDFQGAVCATFAREHLNARNAAIFRDVGNDYSKGLADAFKRTFQQKGGRIVIDSTYNEGDTDFMSQLTTIRSTNPDLIFIPGYYNEVSLIAVQVRKLGMRVPLLGGDGWDSPSLVKTAGRALEGAYFSNHFTPSDTKPVVSKFVKAFQEKYNRVPDAMSALGYDAAWILAEAITKAGSTDGDVIRRALTQIKDYPGVTGKITINAERNATKPAIMLQIKGKDFVPVTSITPEQVR